VSAPADMSPAERTDLAWQRTGLGLLSVSGLIGARALKDEAPSLLIVGGVALVIGLAVLTVLTPLRRRRLRHRADDIAAPRVVAAATIAVVLVTLAAGVAVLMVPVR
jgi:putative membrane protein